MVSRTRRTVRRATRLAGSARRQPTCIATRLARTVFSAVIMRVGDPAVRLRSGATARTGEVILIILHREEVSLYQRAEIRIVRRVAHEITVRCPSEASSD